LILNEKREKPVQRRIMNDERSHGKEQKHYRCEENEENRVVREVI